MKCKNLATSTILFSRIVSYFLGGFVGLFCCCCFVGGFLMVLLNPWHVDFMSHYGVTWVECGVYWLTLREIIQTVSSGEPCWNIAKYLKCLVQQLKRGWNWRLSADSPVLFIYFYLKIISIKWTVTTFASVKNLLWFLFLEIPSHKPSYVLFKLVSLGYSLKIKKINKMNL